jgi:hypothetical protein
MTLMPTWLQEHLIQTGVMTKDHVTKHARPRRCTCGLYTLTGLDDLMPSVVHVDPLPTTPTGEALAQLSGRKTYALDGDQLFERTAGRIEFRDADHTPVYAEHLCNSPLPINAKFMPRQPADLNGPCPF